MYRTLTFGQQRFILATPPCRPATTSLSLTLVSTTPSPGPVPEAVAYILSSLSNGNCGTPDPTRAGYVQM